MKNFVSEINTQILESADKCLQVAIAESVKEKSGIYRLRYRVYVEEMGRRLPSADHKNRLVFDELDNWAVHVYAQAGSEIIGAARLNIGTLEEYPPELVQMFHMDVFQVFNKGRSSQRLGFSSKYLVDAAHRKSQASYLVGNRSYEIYRAEGVQFTFGGGNPHMIPLYERLGFRRFADNFAIPEYGCMVPMVILNEDASHLRAVRSPFYRDARRRKNDPAAAEWFLEKFPTATRFVNTRLVNEHELWLILQEKLGGPPHLAISVLDGLTEEQARKFVHNGVVHLFKKGESIFAPGDFCHEMNILLTGVLEVNNPATNNPLDATRVKPGELCGRVTLLEPGKQTVQATAETEAELLVIPAMAFEAFSHSHPVIAHKILLNLGGGCDRKERLFPLTNSLDQI